MTSPYDFFKTAIRELRDRHGMNQTEAAALCGTARVNWNRWEKGKALPNLDQVLKVADGFTVSVDSLLRGGEAQQAEHPSLPAPPQDDPELTAHLAAVREILTSDHEVAKRALLNNLEAFHQMVTERRESRRRVQTLPRGKRIQR